MTVRVNIGRHTRFCAKINTAFPPIGQMVGVAGKNLHYIAASAGDAPALVLLHGASGNLRDWNSSIVGDLSTDWRVIAFDRPGYGHSDPLIEGSWLLAAQTDTLREAMARLGYRRYALLGHSYGVAVALDWAIRYPEEVTGILAISGAMASWKGALGWRYRWGGHPLIGAVMSAALPYYATEARLLRELEEVFHPQPVPDAYVTNGGVPLAVRPATFALNLRAMDTLFVQSNEMRDQIASIDAPVEIVHGSGDIIVPYDPVEGPTAGLAKHTHLDLLEGIGHMPHHVAKQGVLAAANRLSALI